MKPGTAIVAFLDWSDPQRGSVTARLGKPPPHLILAADCCYVDPGKLRKRPKTHSNKMPLEFIIIIITNIIIILGIIIIPDCRASQVFCSRQASQYTALHSAAQAALQDTSNDA